MFLRKLCFLKRAFEDPAFLQAITATEAAQTPLPKVRFDSTNANDRLCKAFGRVANLDAFGDFSRAEIAAAGSVADYVFLTQKGSMPRLRPLQQVQSGWALDIDPASRRNLELFATQNGQAKGSLFSLINRTLTSSGSRRLREWLALAFCASGADRRPPECGRCPGGRFGPARGLARIVAAGAGYGTRADPACRWVAADRAIYRLF